MFYRRTLITWSFQSFDIQQVLAIVKIPVLFVACLDRTSLLRLLRGYLACVLGLSQLYRTDVPLDAYLPPTVIAENIRPYKHKIQCLKYGVITAHFGQ